jgi:hypothetical protein
MPEPENDVKPPQPDKAGVIHNTPLKPGMTMKDLRPDDPETSTEKAEAELLRKRIAAVTIVKDIPVRPKLRVVVATLKNGKSDILYHGFDHAAARKALVVDTDKHRHVELFETPTKRVRFNLSEIRHDTPLLPGESMKAMRARLSKTNPTPDQETELYKRGMNLSKLSDADLKIAAQKAGVSVDEINKLPEDEQRNELIEAILEKEFPEQGSEIPPDENPQDDSGAPGSKPSPVADNPPGSTTPPPLAGKPKGLGK